MDTGQKIRYFRNIRNMRQKDLAEKSGIPLITIQHYEQGKISPSPERTEELAQALDIDPLELTDTYAAFQAIKCRDRKIVFTDGYNNGFEQLIFYDSLEKVRSIIDDVEDEKERKELASCLDSILSLIGVYKEKMDEARGEDVSAQWKVKQNTLS